MTLRTFLLLAILTTSFEFSFSQQKSKVQVLHANKGEGRKELGPNVRLLLGNVELKHQNTHMFCDSAYVYQDSNYVEAYHNIHIIQNDSIHLYGDYLTYVGSIGLAKVRQNVKVEKQDIILYTDFMDFDRIKNIGYYYNGGEVLSGDNNLISDWGYYYPDYNEVHFKDSVVVTNPKYTIFSDTLIYNTVSEVSSILGPTFIVSDDNIIYSEDGYYDTMHDKAKLQKNSYIQGKEQLLLGDTIFYDRNDGMGEVFSNFELHDTTNHIIIKGDYGYYNEKTEYALATDMAQLLQIYRTDTLFLHADTLKAVPLPQDTSKILQAYYNVKFFRKDMQGRCDSMVYDFRDSTNTFYNTPILWAQNNQMTAQTIKLYTRNQAMYKADLINSAFVVAPDDSIFYNQIKGRNMTGYFRDNDIYKIDVDGNGQTVYYPKDDQLTIGVNRAESSSLTIHLKNRAISGIMLKGDPSGNLNPPLILPVEDVRLQGFIWLDEIRPKNKMDIFRKIGLPEMTEVTKVYDDYKFGDE
ncbi:OstA-like protein [Carboxylicivirga caseinilyticus]|uniref:OstA-like protein n=1 Tax=Carboxylicivirga caseinilyticus TaxID=3417572 RepID=UPI003D326054|nr:organic solvent tolerance protein OstA [Marinilabiliaceae bacterium A049]